MIEKQDFRTFLFGLLGERKRRLAILMYWHQRAPGKSSTLRGLWAYFISTLLQHKLAFTLTDECFFPFGLQHKAFAVQYNWLTSYEMSFIRRVAHEHEQYFDKRGIFVHNKHSEYLFPLIWRHQLLRDFCALVEQLKPEYRIDLFMVLQAIGIERADRYCIILSNTILGQRFESINETPMGIAQ